MPIASQRANSVNSATIKRSGDMASIVERNEAACYLYSLAHTQTHAKNPAIDMPTKNITVPKSIGTASDASTLLKD
tara:strand:- start:1590 stop:1817 length:228 start_codon:yes stop_codon:yes gene_type:complete